MLVELRQIAECPGRCFYGLLQGLGREQGVGGGIVTRYRNLFVVVERLGNGIGVAQFGVNGVGNPVATAAKIGHFGRTTGS